MKRLVNFRLIYLLLFFFLSGFLFYLSFLTYQDYKFPYSKLSRKIGTISKFSRGAQSANESEKYIFELNLIDSASIYLYEGFDEITIKQLKENKLIGQKLSCRYQEKFRQGKIIYNPKELLVGDQTIVDYSRRKEADFKFLMTLLISGSLVFLVSVYLLSAVLYVIRNPIDENQAKSARRLVGYWFIS